MNWSIVSPPSKQRRNFIAEVHEKHGCVFWSQSAAGAQEMSEIKQIKQSVLIMEVNHLSEGTQIILLNTTIKNVKAFDAEYCL